MAERIGGRPRQITRADIVRAGRELGLRNLSLNAVASTLGVTSAALYRHVDGRWGLETLVGESLLEQLPLTAEPRHDVVAHLVAFGTGLREFALGHPGLAEYLQTLFPRGESGRRVLAAQIEALGTHGYAPDAALVLCSAVASIAIGEASAQERRSSRADELEQQVQAVWDGLLADARLEPAHQDLPQVTPAEFSRLVLTAAVQGMVAAAPPGRPVAELIAALESVAPTPNPAASVPAIADPAAVAATPGSAAGAL